MPTAKILKETANDRHAWTCAVAWKKGRKCKHGVKGITVEQFRERRMAALGKLEAKE